MDELQSVLLLLEAKAIEIGADGKPLNKDAKGEYVVPIDTLSQLKTMGVRVKLPKKENVSLKDLCESLEKATGKSLVWYPPLFWDRYEGEFELKTRFPSDYRNSDGTLYAARLLNVIQLEAGGYRWANSSIVSYAVLITEHSIIMIGVPTPPKFKTKPLDGGEGAVQ
jgi:hypothetical protein